MSKRVDEADLLFGSGDGSKIGVAEAELIFAMQSAGLSTQLKLETQKAFRAADADGKRRMLEKFCGPFKETRS
jgi:hypothetical protein